MRKPSYRSTTWLWYGLAVMIAALSYASFATAGRAIALQGAFKRLFTQEQYALIQNSFTHYTVNYYGLLAAATAFWTILLFADRFGSRIAVQYASGLAINMQRRMTLLEVNCMNCSPLICVCGGRARRSTYRGRSVEGFKALPPALVCGLKVLRQVGGPQNVRLAYHLWPVADITISTLPPTSTDLHEGSQADKYLLGVEKDLTVICAVSPKHPKKNSPSTWFSCSISFSEEWRKPLKRLAVMSTNSWATALYQSLGWMSPRQLE